MKVLTPSFEHDAITLFTHRLENFASEFPEVGEKRGVLEEVGHGLITALDIAPPFFGDEHNSLLFTSMADRFNSLRVDTEVFPAKLRNQELAFIGNAIRLAAGSHVIHNNSPESLTNTQESHGRRPLLEIYDEIRNTELQARIEHEIEVNDLFKTPRERLGIPDSREESPFKIHVLDIIDVGPNADPEKDPARYAKTRVLLSGIKYKRTPGVAWVGEVDGVSHMAIPYLHALQLFSDNEEVAARTRATLEHEYVHTQGWRADRNLYTSLEEHRANALSRGTTGYENEKYYFNEVRELGGFDAVGAVVEKQRRGELRPTIHREIVHALGLGALADIAYATPESRERGLGALGVVTGYMQNIGLVPGLLAHTLLHKGISPELIRERKREYDTARYPVFTV